MNYTYATIFVAAADGELIIAPSASGQVPTL